MRGKEDSTDEDGEERRGLESDAYARGNQGASRNAGDSGVWWC
jgi:hypothetical protein